MTPTTAEVMAVNGAVNFRLPWVVSMKGPLSRMNVAPSHPDTVPLRLSYVSKGSLGYELLVEEHAMAVQAQPLRLKEANTVEKSLRCIEENCLTQVHGNARGVVSGHAPSSVHQMRAGLRRLRSVFDLFEGVITPPPFPKSCGGSRANSVLHATGKYWQLDLARCLRRRARRYLRRRSHAGGQRNGETEPHPRGGGGRLCALYATHHRVTRWIDQAAWREGLE